MWETLATAAVSLGVATIGVWGSNGGFGRRWLRTIREEIEVYERLDPTHEQAVRLRAHIERRLDWYTLSKRERWSRRGDRVGTVAGLTLVIFAFLDWLRVLLSGERPTELTVWLTTGMVVAIVLGLGAVSVGRWRRRRRSPGTSDRPQGD